MKAAPPILALTGLFAGPLMAAPPGVSPFAGLAQSPPTGDSGKTTVRPGNQSIIAQSTILHDGETWTLLPKGAVLYTPPSRQANVDAKPVGKLLTWNEFLVKNRAWIGTQEVDLDQAAGKRLIPEDRLQAWSKQNQVIVAVYLSGPISLVSPPSESITTTAQNP
ncbi:hypothetical protein [Luteolibacter marinus]|uniref:hypothetical protein n=1 Tax=Luteolibacter marinus TaxID=2776705 RepID=UPI00186891E6|nr:hypothetical protein [Luteolibacter marinus]